MELTGRGGGGARGAGLSVTTRWHYEQHDNHEKAKPPQVVPEAASRDSKACLAIAEGSAEISQEHCVQSQTPVFTRADPSLSGCERQGSCQGREA